MRAWDDMIDRGPAYSNDDQLRRIANALQYRGDRVRTCEVPEDPRSQGAAAHRHPRVHSEPQEPGRNSDGLTVPRAGRGGWAADSRLVCRGRSRRFRGRRNPRQSIARRHVPGRLRSLRAAGRPTHRRVIRVRVRTTRYPARSESLPHPPHAPAHPRSYPMGLAVHRRPGTGPSWRWRNVRSSAACARGGPANPPAAASLSKTETAV